MLHIGLTGGIGSGKTTVSDLFHSLYNVPVIDADEISRNLLLPSGRAYQETIELFGAECLLESTQIDRKHIRKKIFADDELRASLEKTIHPKVKDEIEIQIESFTSQYCLIVIPLLIESNMQFLIDRILVIDTHIQNQIDRVIARDECSRNDVENIVTAQLAAEERLRHANDVIENNGNIDDLTRQIHQLHQKYLELTT